MFNIEKWGIIWKHRQSFFDGTVSTVIMALAGLAIALILGVIFGLMSTSGRKPLRVISRIYVEFIQNTPLMFRRCSCFIRLRFRG